jgi:hypothetical protein
VLFVHANDKQRIQARVDGYVAEALARAAGEDPLDRLPSRRHLNELTFKPETGCKKVRKRFENIII